MPVTIEVMKLTSKSTFITVCKDLVRSHFPRKSDENHRPFQRRWIKAAASSTRPSTSCIIGGNVRYRITIRKITSMTISSINRFTPGTSYPLIFLSGFYAHILHLAKSHIKYRFSIKSHALKVWLTVFPLGFIMVSKAKARLSYIDSILIFCVGFTFYVGRKLRVYFSQPNLCLTGKSASIYNSISWDIEVYFLWQKASRCSLW